VLQFLFLFYNSLFERKIVVNVEVVSNGFHRVRKKQLSRRNTPRRFF